MSHYKRRSVADTKAEMAPPPRGGKDAPLHPAVAHYGPALDALCDAPGAFAPLPKPKPGDWLSEQTESGQPFRSFLRGAFKAEPHAAFCTVNLVLVGDGFPAATVSALREFASAFYVVPVRVVGPVPLRDMDGVRSRVNADTGEAQLFCDGIMDWVQRHVTKNSEYARSSVCSIAMTLEDLVNKEEWNWVYGLASLVDGTGVFSLKRFTPAFNGERVASAAEADAVVLRRACRVVCHELGHIFGLRHCVNFQCIMNGANHVGELEAQVPLECPACCKKLMQSFGWDLEARYASLAAQYATLGFTTEHHWVTTAVLPSLQTSLAAAGPLPREVGRKYAPVAAVSSRLVAGAKAPLKRAAKAKPTVPVKTTG